MVKDGAVRSEIVKPGSPAGTEEVPYACVNPYEGDYLCTTVKNFELFYPLRGKEMNPMHVLSAAVLTAGLIAVSGYAVSSVHAESGPTFDFMLVAEAPGGSSGKGSSSGSGMGSGSSGSGSHGTIHPEAGMSSGNSGSGMGGNQGTPGGMGAGESGSKGSTGGKNGAGSGGLGSSGSPSGGGSSGIGGSGTGPTSGSGSGGR